MRSRSSATSSSRAARISSFVGLRGVRADGGYGYFSFKTMEDNVLLGFSVGIKRKVACAERACVWTVDPGANGCPANGQPCAQTCPAPTCALTTRENELSRWSSPAPRQ